MIPTWILVSICAAIMLICLGVGANASIKTADRSPQLALKFGFFMALAHFAFYYIGVFACKLFIDLTFSMRNAIIVVVMLTMTVKTIWNVFSYKAEDNFFVISKTPIMLYLSLASGLNALLMGIAMTLSGAAILQSALLVSLGAFLGAFSGAGFSPRVASVITRLKPAIVSALIFLGLTIFYFLRFRGVVS